MQKIFMGIINFFLKALGSGFGPEIFGKIMSLVGSAEEMTLSDEEKEGLNEAQQKALLGSRRRTYVVTEVVNYAGPLVSKVAGIGTIGMVVDAVVAVLKTAGGQAALNKLLGPKEKKTRTAKANGASTSDVVASSTGDKPSRSASRRV